MRKLLFSAVLLFGLSACTPKYESANESYPVLPPELQDCTIHRIYSTSGKSALVFRCPHSTTSTNYKSGKSKRTVVVESF